jgi:Resolvase, N terminal domain
VNVVLVRASDRIARSVKHFLDVLDELNRLNIEFISFREQFDTGGPLGRAVVVIIGAIAELERNLIIERVRPACGGRSSKAATSDASPLFLIATPSCEIGSADRVSSQLAKGHLISRATIHRVLRDAQPSLEKSA